MKIVFSVTYEDMWGRRGHERKALKDKRGEQGSAVGLVHPPVENNLFLDRRSEERGHVRGGHMSRNPSEGFVFVLVTRRSVPICWVIKAALLIKSLSSARSSGGAADADRAGPLRSLFRTDNSGRQKESNLYGRREDFVTLPQFSSRV